MAQERTKASPVGCREARSLLRAGLEDALVTGNLVENGVLTLQTTEGLEREEKEAPAFNVARLAPSTHLMLTFNKAMFSLGLGYSPATQLPSSLAPGLSQRVLPVGWHCQGNGHVADCTTFLEPALPWMTTSRSGSVRASARLQAMQNTPTLGFFSSPPERVNLASKVKIRGAAGELI